MKRSTLLSGVFGLLPVMLHTGCSGSTEALPVTTEGGGGMGSSASTGTTLGAASGTLGPQLPPGGLSELMRSCGNSILDRGEQCDDGNQTGGDGCTRLCQQEADAICPVVGKPCIPSAVCGDGKLASVESCDDGNTLSGDGCASDCKAVEPGWQCRRPGKACFPICGDKVLTGPEACDDGNTNKGDGCSKTCQRESGFTCTGAPSVCIASQCGNKVLDPGETCDEGDANGRFYGDGSGCSKTCTREPKCRVDGKTQACTTACGDGNRDEGEDCDDGNHADNDGCSSICKLEGGFVCKDQETKDTAPCGEGSAQCLILPITYRDFDGQNLSTGHHDFFYYGATTPSGKTVCVPNASGRDAGTSGTCWGNDSTPLCLGLANSTLGADGKPTLNTTRAGGSTCACRFTDWDKTGILTGVAGTTTCSSGGSGTITRIELPSVPIIQSAASFKEWYSEGPRSTEFVSTLKLAQIGTSNQYRFSSTGGRGVYDDLHDIFLLQGPAVTGQPIPAGAVDQLSSGFFELEASPRPKVCNLWPYWTAPATCVGPQWDARGWSGNQATPPSPPPGVQIPKVTGLMRNFYMTSEVRYLFRYVGGETLQFFGDDDVWVYLNGKLVLDLGAPHERLQGTVTLTDAASTANVSAQDVISGTFIPVGTPQVTRDLGLTKGKTYEIAVFHADVHPRESNYELTLSGFSTTRTHCDPECGNQVITAGEECDDGTNNKPPTDAYGACTTDCTYGPYCGDSTINGSEVCDNGPKNGAPYGTEGGCTSDCQPVHFCGDEIIDGTAGEACDGGAGCDPKTCQIIPS